MKPGAALLMQQIFSIKILTADEDGITQHV